MAHAFLIRNGAVSCDLCCSPAEPDSGGYAAGGLQREQTAPPAVREERRQPAAQNPPPARQAPRQEEAEDEANSYDSDEGSKSPFLSLLVCAWFDKANKAMCESLFHYHSS